MSFNAKDIISTYCLLKTQLLLAASSNSMKRLLSRMKNMPYWHYQFIQTYDLGAPLKIPLSSGIIHEAIFQG